MSRADQPYKWGEMRPVNTKAVPTANVIAKGDLVGLEAADGDPYSATAESWDTDLATTQANFKARFLGASADRSQTGETEEIRVGAGGVWEFDCAAATFEIGDLVGPAKDTGNALLAGTVVGVTAAEAIGRVVKRYGSNTTTVLVEIASTLLP